MREASPADAAADRELTIQHLSKKHAFFKNLHFDARIILLPSTLPAPDKLPAELIRYLQGLADEAYQTASSQAYSSILAGQGNETDEAWDVPIYLGERPSSGGEGSQEDWAWIVQVLGGKEEGLVDEEVSARPPDQPQKVLPSLKSLQDPIFLEIQLEGDSETVLLYVGRYKGTNHWAGLLSYGVFT